MTAIRVAVLTDLHGNSLALDAVRAAIRKERPDAILVGGDLALNGPDPAGTVDGVRELEAEGALVIAGADFDFSAAFPWFSDGAPESYRIAAEWAHDTLGTERVEWLRRLPAERRIWCEETLVLLTHASPGSQTAGFDAVLDPTVVVERLARTDARVICCGHTHIPEIRDFGWKMIVNAGSAGYVLDGEPTASWAMVEVEGDQVRAEIRRTPFDELAAADAISARGLPGDVYRAATVRTGKLVR